CHPCRRSDLSPMLPVAQDPSRERREGEGCTAAAVVQSCPVRHATTLTRRAFAANFARRAKLKGPGRWGAAPGPTPHEGVRRLVLFSPSERGVESFPALCGLSRLQSNRC